MRLYMRDVKRIKRILKLIEDIWRKQPDLRLAQLLLNAINEADWNYYLEDDELEKALRYTYKR